MYFYFLIIPVLIGSCYMIWRLRRMAKHDRVLFRFCQNRRDIMAIIRGRNFDLPREDYIALRELLEVTNNTIHEYNVHKTSLFDFRKFIRDAQRLNSIRRKMEELDNMNTDVAHLYHKFGLSMLYAFFTYTRL